MVRPAAQAMVTDRWAAVVFSATIVALLSSGLVSATFTQAQLVDVTAVFLGVAGSLAALAVAAGGWTAMPRTRLSISWTAFMGWTLLTAVLSQRVWTSLMGESTSMLGWFTLAATVSIALAAALRGGAAREFLTISAPWVLVVQATFVLVQVLQASSAGPFDMGAVARGTMANSTALGEMVVLLLPWTMAKASKSRFAMPQNGRWAVVALTIIVLSVSGSRAALAVALIWVVSVLISRTSMSARARVLTLAGLCTVVVVAAVVVVGPQFRDKTGTGILGLRPEMWRVGVQATAQSPLFGYGLDGFVAGGAVVSTPEFVSKTSPLIFTQGATDPHNLLILIAVSTGLIGLAVFLWACVEVGFAWRLRRKGGVEIGPGVWGVCGALVIFLTAPVYISLLPLFAFVLGVSVAARPRVRDSGAKRVAGLGLLGVLGVASCLLATNALTRVSLEVPSAQNSPGLSGRAQAATKVWALDSHLAGLASLHWAWAAQADPAIAQQRVDLGDIQRAVELDRRSPFNALEFARTLAYYQMPSEQVDSAFEDTLIRWPLYPIARATYAEYLARTGRIDEAKEQLARALSVEMNDQDFAKAVERAKAAIAGQTQ